MSLGCGVDDIDLQILSCVVGIVVYVSIGPSLTFSVGMVSFLGFPTLFGCFVWSGSVVYRFIDDTGARMGFCFAIWMGFCVSLLYCWGVSDPATVNCKGCD